LTYGGEWDTTLPHQQLDVYYDTCVIFLGSPSGEGHDRKTLGFGEEVENMVKRFGKHNKEKGKKTVVVMTVPGASTTAFRDDVDAILVQFYPGEMAAQSAVTILFGDAVPSGKLPMTFPLGENDQNFTKSQYPGVKSSALSLHTNANYTEGLFIGYRWYDQNEVEPAYPFGHGLSYTTFEYDTESVKVEGRNVSVTVKNSGDVDGKEVVQLYVGFPESANEPPKLLKGFKKLSLAVGESKEAQFTLTDRDLSVYDVESHSWKLVEGEFDLFIGSSSRDIRATAQLSTSSEVQIEFI